MKLAIAALAALLLVTIVVTTVISTVMAQTMPNISIRKIGLLGKGLAISGSDPKDIHEIKIGVALFAVRTISQDTNVSAGIMYFDTTRYILKNIQTSNKTVSADIYQNDTQSGSLQASLVSKPRFNLWAGTITINETTYNLYILEGTRLVKALELADKVSDYCVAHHDDANCSDKIKEYCQNNPTDTRCVVLFRNYCRKNLDDETCRNELKAYCSQKPNSDSDACKDFCKENPLVCGVKVKKCKNCPDGYKPTADGFCAPSCTRKKVCAQTVIDCPVTSTTTSSITTSSITTTLTTTPTTTTTQSATTTTSTTTTQPATSTTTSSMTSSTTTTVGGG